MKLLFVCNNAYQGNDSVSNILKVLMDYLENRHDIFVLSRIRSLDGQPKYKKRGKIKYIFFHPSAFCDEVDTYLVEKCNWTEKNKWEKMVFLLLRPMTFLKKLVYKIQSLKDFEYAYNHRIKLLDKRYRFDAVVAMATPYSIARALAKAEIYGKKIIYELDPYYTNYYYGKGKEKKYLKEEQKVLENIDLAIMTDMIYKENQKNELRKYRKKMRWLEYPNVRELNTNCKIDGSPMDINKINCFFIGSFYDEIRNPEFVLNIFSRMKNKDIVFHIVGSGGEKEVKKYKKIMSERLQIHGRETRERALFLMQNADILVGINNSISNQMPGKIFDYISTGRPILNFCYLDGCPSLKYMEKYPLVMNIFEKQKTDINIVEEFCEKNKGKYLPFEDIKALFNENTVETVGSEFERLIKECIKGLNK